MEAKFKLIVDEVRRTKPGQILPTDDIYNAIYKAGYEEGRLYGRQESLLNQAIIDHQVKDAKKSGIREVVEWIEKENPFSFIYRSSTTWQAKLKEWGEE